MMRHMVHIVSQIKPKQLLRRMVMRKKRGLLGTTFSVPDCSALFLSMHEIVESSEMMLCCGKECTKTCSPKHRFLAVILIPRINLIYPLLFYFRKAT